jgi:uncharacterized membrane protein YdfJ with MMPL/SSD domain
VSRRIAEVLYRRRILLTALILVGAVVLAPRANVTRIDNDLTAWFSRDDPIYREYERFRDEFGGTRNLIVAIKAPSRERMFEAATFRALDDMSADIERVDAVERVSSLATATVVDARPARAGVDAEQAGALREVALRVERAGAGPCYGPFGRAARTRDGAQRLRGQEGKGRVVTRPTTVLISGFLTFELNTKE